MNEAQQKFIKTQSAVLDKYCESKIKGEPNPTKLNDYWQNVRGFIDVTVAVCSGHESEARNALWDITDKWTEG